MKTLQWLTQDIYKSHFEFLSVLYIVVRFGIWSLLTVSTTKMVAFLDIGINSPNITLLPLKGRKNTRDNQIK